MVLSLQLFWLAREWIVLSSRTQFYQTLVNHVHHLFSVLKSWPPHFVHFSARPYPHSLNLNLTKQHNSFISESYQFLKWNWVEHWHSHLLKFIFVLFIIIRHWYFVRSESSSLPLAPTSSISIASLLFVLFSLTSTTRANVRHSASSLYELNATLFYMENYSIDRQVKKQGTNSAITRSPARRGWEGGQTTTTRTMLTPTIIGY